ncbi:MAG: hypothetical protein HOP08_06985 [Cyclobacteriaceae bacterium]|nr:hypothetical protein [Cyclobacteriaceae bacterium]
MDSIGKNTVPRQVTGNELNVEHSVISSSVAAAKYFFRNSSQKLLDVNHWHTLTHPSISVFQLTDENGKAVEREVHQNDYFRINVPGPTTKTGNGYDWVKVEKLDVKNSDNEESISLQVRPAGNPQHPQEGTSHFFSDSATSTFQILRKGLRITAGIYGRNELPNTDSNKVVDKVRNITIATFAIMGASRMQWESLTKGLLGNPF